MHVSVIDDLTRQILCGSADVIVDVKAKGGGGFGTSCAQNRENTNKSDKIPMQD